MMEDPKKLPGGLVMTSELPTVRLDPFESRLFPMIIRSGFKFDSKIIANSNKRIKEASLRLIKGFDEKPTKMSTYVALHHIVSSMELCHQQMSAEESTCSCTVMKAGISEERQVYEVQVTQQFFEMNNVSSAGFIMLKEFGKNSMMKGRIVNIDTANFVLGFNTVWDNHMDIKTDSTKYAVSFEPSTFTFRAREQILQWLKNGVTNGSDFLVFPDEPYNKSSLSVSIEQYQEGMDAKIAAFPFSSDKFNKCQKEAIFAILCGLYNGRGNLPYILHGPPGTGKTTTIVEAIRLLLIAPTGFRILVCTPSNTAADLVAHELLKTEGIQNDVCLTNDKLFRMFSLTKSIDTQAQELRDISCIVSGGDGEYTSFGIYPREKLLTFRVIVCTLSASSYLSNGGLKGAFSHIFIDEAAQASEIDTLIPIVGLRDLDTKIILAGDFHQLGPVAPIRYFEQKGLVASLIERLSKKDYYKNNPMLMTMLVENYRSHPDIISVPSKLFYHDKLIASPNASPKDSLVNWSKLPKKGVPILWHHCSEKEKKFAMLDAKLHGGHSFCNHGELREIVTYVNHLVTELKISPEDIGIVTPYKLQVLELTHAIAKDHLGITIDTVERFQGSERRVMIVSPVRSTSPKELGFVDCPKRFNTTITRAKELLIVVGNAYVMCGNKEWKRLLKYFVEKEAIVGVNPSDLAGFLAEDASGEPTAEDRPPSFGPVENGNVLTNGAANPTVNGNPNSTEESISTENDDEEETYISDSDDGENLTSAEEEEEVEESDSDTNTTVIFNGKGNKSSQENNQVDEEEVNGKEHDEDQNHKNVEIAQKEDGKNPTAEEATGNEEKNGNQNQTTTVSDDENDEKVGLSRRREGASSDEDDD